MGGASIMGRGLVTNSIEQSLEIDHFPLINISTIRLTQFHKQIERLMNSFNILLSDDYLNKNEEVCAKVSNTTIFH